MVPAAGPALQIDHSKIDDHGDVHKYVVAHMREAMKPA